MNRFFVTVFLSAIAWPVLAMAQDVEDLARRGPVTLSQVEESVKTMKILKVDGKQQGEKPRKRKKIRKKISASELKRLKREAIKHKVFDTALPLTPKEIQFIRRRLNTRRKAALREEGLVPRVKIESVSLDPGAAPPEINVHSGFVTTLSVFDITGQPWPIQDVGIGGAFQVPGMEAGSHIIRIIPKTSFGIGNLSIRLIDLPTPITFMIKSGEDVVDYRYDARIPKMGPLAQVPLIDRGIRITAGDDMLMALLDGVPPAGALKLVVSGTDGSTTAWRIRDQLYLRTPLTLISPGWSGSISSTDGMQVYAIKETPVVLFSDNGIMLRARIKDRVK